MTATSSLSFFILIKLTGALRLQKDAEKDTQIKSEKDVYTWMAHHNPEHRENQISLHNVDKTSMPWIHASQAWEMKYSKKAYPWTKEYDDDTFLNYIVPITHFDELAEAWMPIMNNALVSKNPEFFKSDKKLKDVAQFVVENTWTAFGGPIEFKPQQTPNVLSPITDVLDKHYGSCTAMSIFLADSLRSVGVPARVAGVAQWNRNEGGNHNWVEAFFNNQWNFIDAVPGTTAWNTGWFVTMGVAQKSKPGGLSQIAVPIWDTSKQTTNYLVTWKKGAEDDETLKVHLSIPAIDRTEFYTKQPSDADSGQVENQPAKGASRLASALTGLPILAVLLAL
eukprot:gnl/MRDRNA2_/MRDRNA2_159062_c0_seq1.p1 gnl/MRDRNA2_/MRDRNA2_159062_c0~~gnl/MRDRNA2_/MRDRNA2_159062_c0_seq1.p1  ORF type:complete len:337 (+),score=56.76 gnl/MRDRNA2_/MRDRNA2_159062_c0_seq1:118-1128(+)